MSALKLRAWDWLHRMSRTTPSRTRASSKGNGFWTHPGANRTAYGLLALIGFSISIVFGCGSKPAAKSVNHFPDSSEADGWSKTGETRVFPADRLWEYIDGDADRFVRAGVERVMTADYSYQNRIDAVADVFVMSAPAGAVTVFESQPAKGSQPLKLGDAARLYKGSLTFRKGRFFVRLVAFADAPEVSQALTVLGHGIESKLD
jgi:Family of unknown function (DUF6599)